MPDLLETYNRILESMSRYLSDSEPTGEIETIRSRKYRKVISRVFATENKRKRHERWWTPYT
jgi:hypothetical protein